MTYTPKGEENWKIADFTKIQLARHGEEGRGTEAGWVAQGMAQVLNSDGGGGAGGGGGIKRNFTVPQHINTYSWGGGEHEL